ncbi:uncharacterized protein EKO05_0008066 [Ascochyta rabiei]|uniref:uncharacterized protein n=1 Tax=Didymella rabiei TaxID=5454 RepID=UPI0021FEDEAC|nr:uncharacterized protein EKO05_0008066 [Ascochyta rabiei]UPX17726.1 hypothetical protein EKO05_0008066 [Ascochyta rabiei]
MEKEREHQTENPIAMTHFKFHEAVTVEELFSVLEALLTVTTGQIYVIVILGLLDQKKSGSSGFAWTQAFGHSFKKISERASSTKDKVLLANYGTLCFQLTLEERARSVIPLKVQVATVRQRKAGRGPRLQQKDLHVKVLPSAHLKRTIETRSAVDYIICHRHVRNQSGSVFYFHKMLSVIGFCRYDPASDFAKKICILIIAPNKISRNHELIVCTM